MNLVTHAYEQVQDVVGVMMNDRQLPIKVDPE